MAFLQLVIAALRLYLARKVPSAAAKARSKVQGVRGGRQKLSPEERFDIARGRFEAVVQGRRDDDPIG